MTPAPNRRWFRWSLRTMFVVLALSLLMLVLPNITAQTGLTFDLEQRPVKTLLVEETQQ